MRGQIGPITLVFWIIAVIVLAALMTPLLAAVDSSSSQFSANDPTRMIIQFFPLLLAGGVAAYLIGSYTGRPSSPNI